MMRMVSYSPATTNSELNTDDPATLISFMTFVTNTAPAKHYGFVYAGHGAGWLGFAEDDSHGAHRMSMNQFQSALKAVSEMLPNGKLDLFAFFGCVMATEEVATELSGHADYMLASQLTVGPHYLNFGDWLQWLAQNPLASPSDFASEMLTAAGMPNSSVVELDKMSSLNAALDLLALRIINASTADKTLVSSVGASSITFGINVPGYADGLPGLDYDLGSLLYNLSHASFADSQISVLAQAALGQYQNTISEYYPANYVLDFGLYPNGTGLSIYMPRLPTPVSGRYASTTFANPSLALGTHWQDMLQCIRGQCPQRIATDFGNAAAGAQPVNNVPNQSATLDSSIDNPGDVDFVSFTGQAGQVLDADLSAAAGGTLNPGMTLYAANGVTVLARATNDVDAAIKNFTLPSTGTYYLALTPADRADPLSTGQGTTMGAYSLSVLTGTAATLAPHLVLGTNTINFGQVNNYPQSQVFLTLSNSGLTALTITNVQVGGTTNFTFEFFDDGVPATIAPQSVALMVVTALAFSNGPASGSLLIQSDDPAQPSAQVNLQSTVAIKAMIAGASFEASQGFSGYLLLQNGLHYRVQGSTNLISWSDITNFLSATPVMPFLDAGATNRPAKFYRLIPP